MALINDNFIKIPATYLFSEIAKRVAQHKEENPSSDAPAGVYSERRDGPSPG